MEGEIPSSFSSLTRLKTLYFVRTSFSGFQNVTSIRLPHLAEISLRGSRMFSSNLNDMLLEAPRLRVIDFAFANAAGISLLTCSQLPNLTFLDLSDIQLGEYISVILQAPMVNLSYLALPNCNLQGNIFPDPADLPRLAYLDLTGNRFYQAVPPDLMLLPLETLKLSAPFTLLPANLGMLNATIRHLQLNAILNAGYPIPPSITALEKLEFLSLKSCHSSGSIPDISHFKELIEVDLSDNSLTGPIPDFKSEKLRILDLHGNLLNGTIPRHVASIITHLDLSYNQFEGAIDEDLFSSNERLDFLRLAQNRFSGRLPRLRTESPLGSIEMTSNQFDGEVPASYCKVYRLALTDNQLSGSPDFLSQYCPNLTYLALDRNLFTGAFNSSWVEGLHSLETLRLARNRFEGDLPMLPANLKVFDASFNKFTSLNIQDWLASPGFQSLMVLDVSRNQMRVPFSFLSLIGPSLTELSAAWGSFQPSDLVVGEFKPFTKLLSLDIRSSTSGTFPDHLFPSVNILLISRNSFEGGLILSRFPYLTLLDISYNRFVFDVATFSSHRFLTNIDASWNGLYGSLGLTGLINLQTANFSHNALNLQPHLASISTLFTSSQLKVLDITYNRFPPFRSLETKTLRLARTSSSEPLASKPKIVDCHSLAFYGKGSGSFLFDTDLFSYLQCDCNEEHFGMPPNDCIKCPSRGSESCQGRLANISSNYYAYFTPKKSDSGSKPLHWQATSPIFSDFKIPSLWTLSSSDKTDLSGEDTKERLEDMDEMTMDTESCLVKTVQLLSQKSNCQGLVLTGPQVAQRNSSLQELLQSQCRVGSDGRLCSRCVCDLEKDESCSSLKDTVARDASKSSAYLPRSHFLLELRYSLSPL